MPCCRAHQNAAQLQLQDKLLPLRCQKHVEDAVAAAEQAAADQVRTSAVMEPCCVTAAGCDWSPFLGRLALWRP